MLTAAVALPDLPDLPALPLLIPQLRCCLLLVAACLAVAARLALARYVSSSLLDESELRPALFLPIHSPCVKCDYNNPQPVDSVVV